MENVVEHGCKQCGGKIMKPSLVPFLLGAPPKPSATTCEECGYETDASKMCGFQCSHQIHSSLHRLCTAGQLKQCRLDPRKFIATLNSELVANGKKELEVDATTKPPTVREKL